MAWTRWFTRWWLVPAVRELKNTFGKQAETKEFARHTEPMTVRSFGGTRLLPRLDTQVTMLIVDVLQDLF